MKLQIELTEDDVKDLINTQAVNASLRAALERYKPTPPPGYASCGPYTLATNFTSHPGEAVFRSILKEVVRAAEREFLVRFQRHMAAFRPDVKVDYDKLVLDIHSRYGFFPPKDMTPNTK
jgi:hypothetical protein